MQDHLILFSNYSGVLFNVIASVIRPPEAITKKAAAPEKCEQCLNDLVKEVENIRLQISLLLLSSVSSLNTPQYFAVYKPLLLAGEETIFHMKPSSFAGSFGADIL